MFDEQGELLGIGVVLAECMGGMPWIVSPNAERVVPEAGRDSGSMSREFACENPSMEIGTVFA